MKKLRAFYFSGTGNTKFVTQYLASKLSTSFDVSQYDVMDKADFSHELSEADIIMIAFPIYGSAPPIPIRNFVTTHKELFNGKTVAIAETQYCFSGDGAASLGRTLGKYGADVRYAEHFNMPNNLADGSFFKVRNGQELEDIMNKAVRRMDEFADKIANGKRFKRGFNVASHAVGYYCQRKWWRRSENLKRSAITINTDKCIGCGLCAKCCPVENLTIYGRHAHGNGKCVFCYRCVNLCPKKAITLFGREIITPYKGIPSTKK